MRIRLLRRLFPLLLLVGVGSAALAQVAGATLDAADGIAQQEDNAPARRASTAPPMPNFRRIEERDGLSHPAVYGIGQDAFGFMWLGTLEGVDRFDGVDMRSFRPDPQVSGVVCGGPKVSVYVDRADRVWIGTIGRGACMYDTRSGAWRTYFGSTSAPEGTAAVTVRDFLQGEDGTIWMATSEGLAGLAPDGATPTLLRNDPADANSLAHNDVYALAADNAGTLWIGTRGGLDAYDPAAGLFTHYRYNPADPQSLSSGRVFDVLVDAGGSIWLGTWDGGLNQLDPGSGAIRTFRHTGEPNSLSSDQIMKLWEDSAGRLWIGTYGGGLDLFDAQTGQFFNYRYDPANLNSLSNNNVVSLFEDRAGMLWVGTEGGGISVLNLYPLPFTVYSRAADGQDTIAPGLILAFAEDSAGGLLIGTNAGGVTRLDRSSGAFTYLQADPDKPGSLASNVVGGMLYARNGVLWVGTSQGLNRYDAATGTFTLYQHDPADPNSLSDNSVYQILEDDDGTLWIGTYGGLNHFAPQTGVFTRYVSRPDDPNSLSSNIVRVLMPGAGDDLWIGTQDGGLNRLDRASGQITRYPGDPADPQRLSGNGITGLARDDTGMIWVATDDAGLNRLDPQTGAVTRYGAANELADLRIMALADVGDENGADALWMSTGSGLARFDLQAETFRNFDSNDGLPRSDFVPYSVYRNRQGELLFGGLDSVVAFQPAAIEESRVQPEAQFAELYINNQPQPIGGDGILAAAIFATDAITMPAGEQAITVMFSAPGYADARNVRFRFRLGGFNPDWVAAQPMQRAATYTGLDPGRYVFQLQAAGRNGIWNEPGRQLVLTLEPAWWQLWWVRALAILLSVALLTAAIVGGFQTRLRMTRRRNEMLEQEVAARTTELSALLSVSQSITSERDLDPLLVRVLDNVRHAIPHAGGILLLRSGNAGEVEAYSVVGEAATIAKSSVPLGTFHAVAMTVSTGRLFKLPELNGNGEDMRALTGLVADQASGGAWIAAPLVEQGEVIGSMLLYDIKPEAFVQDDLPKLQRFANQLAIALENARLQAQAQRLAVDLERSRLSRELHDSVTQLLHSISLHANAAERALALGRPAHGAENMRQTQHLAQEAIHELRTLIFELRLTPLEESGLQAALKAYLETVVARSGLAVHLDARTQRRWPQDVEFELYRIAQEALTNVVKHASATRVVVSLRESERCQDQGCVTLEIVDNGVGFDPTAAQQRGTIGLHSMAERAQKIGACFTVQSQAGRGAAVRVELGGETHGGTDGGAAGGNKPAQDTGADRRRP